MKKENVSLIVFIIFIVVLIGGIIIYAIHLDEKSGEEISQKYLSSTYMTQKPFIRSKEKETKAKEDMIAMSTMKKEDINMKIWYIKLHMNQPFSSQEITENILYNAAFLMNLPIKTETLSDNKIVKLGEIVGIYIKEIYTGEQEEQSELSMTRKQQIKDMIEDVEKNMDENIESILKSINK